MSRRYLNREQLETEKGIKWHRTTIVRKVAAGDFPAPISKGGKDGKNAIMLWRESEIDKWIESNAVEGGPTVS